jgi:hypothetical protein
MHGKIGYTMHMQCENPRMHNGCNSFGTDADVAIRHKRPGRTPVTALLHMTFGVRWTSRMPVQSEMQNAMPNRLWPGFRHG